MNHFWICLMQYLGHTYTQKWFIAYLKFTFLCDKSGNSILSKHLKPFWLFAGSGRKGPTSGNVVPLCRERETWVQSEKPRQTAHLSFRGGTEVGEFRGRGVRAVFHTFLTTAHLYSSEKWMRFKKIIIFLMRKCVRSVKRQTFQVHFTNLCPNWE